MIRELEEKQKEIERQQDERHEMQHKIQQMQSKLITGGKDIITHTSEQEQTLRQKQFVFLNRIIEFLRVLLFLLL